MRRSSAVEVQQQILSFSARCAGGCSHAHVAGQTARQGGSASGGALAIFSFVLPPELLACDTAKRLLAGSFVAVSRPYVYSERREAVGLADATALMQKLSASALIALLVDPAVLPLRPGGNRGRVWYLPNLTPVTALVACAAVRWPWHVAVARLSRNLRDHRLGASHRSATFPSRVPMVGRTRYAELFAVTINVARQAIFVPWAAAS